MDLTRVTYKKTKMNDRLVRKKIKLNVDCLRAKEYLGPFSEEIV